MGNNKFKVGYVILPSLIPLGDNLSFIVNHGIVYCKN